MWTDEELERLKIGLQEQKGQKEIDFKKVAARVMTRSAHSCKK